MSSACAKFILGGEHSVVVRGRAMAFPLPELRLELMTKTSSAKITRYELILNGELRSEGERLLVEELCRKLGVKNVPGAFEINSQIPIGSGLGSSAALCVALTRHFFPLLTPSEQAKLALTGEELFHRRPSGIDPFTIALETPIVYRASDKSFRTLQCEAFKKSGYCFALVDSSATHNTKQVQESVEKSRTRDPLIYDDLMTALSSNVEDMLQSFESGEIRPLGRLIRDTHFRLIQLGVSNEHLNELCEKFQSYDSCLGAKITGAGCGGFVLALLEWEKLPHFIESVHRDFGKHKAIFSYR